MTYQAGHLRDTLEALRTARTSLERARIEVVRSWMSLVHDSDREAFWNQCVSVDPNCRDILGDDAGVISDWYAVCDPATDDKDGPPGAVHAIFREHHDAVEFYRDLVSMTSPSSAVIVPFRFMGVMRVE